MIVVHEWFAVFQMHSSAFFCTTAKQKGTSQKYLSAYRYEHSYWNTTLRLGSIGRLWVPNTYNVKNIVLSIIFEYTRHNPDHRKNLDKKHYFFMTKIDLNKIWTSFFELFGDQKNVFFFLGKSILFLIFKKILEISKFSFFIDFS